MLKNPFQILAVHIHNEEQAQNVCEFLQKFGVDYEELQGEEWICNECGESEKAHNDDECPTL